MPATSLQNQLLGIFLYLGTSWVLYLLLGLSVLSVAVALERLWHFWQHRGNLLELQQSVEQLLQQHDVAAIQALLAHNSSYPAQVMLVGLAALPAGAAAVEEMVASQTVRARLNMERRLAFLGTLGNNAPFIGLFGTVLGIIRAFRDLSVHTSAASQAVMAGIAESLVATAVGLLVALPAVMTFNYLQRCVRAQLLEIESLVHGLLAYAKRLNAK